MEKTEEVLREQLINAMQDGKYRILLHRANTDGDDLSQDGITKSICRDGLKIFGDTNISFSTSDYRNDIDMIMEQIRVAYTYKGSDKVFILKVPANGLEYTPGNTKPILYETNESNQYNNKCNVLLPKYVLGFVDVSKEGISELHHNTEARQDLPKNLHFTSAITAKYRETHQQILQGIRSDRLYTNEEKKSFLHILYSNYGYKGNVSTKLKKLIKTQIPESDLEKKIAMTSLNIEEINVVNKFYSRNARKRITVKTIEEEFETPRRLKQKEIYSAIPSLINRENEKGRALELDEIIHEISKVHGFNENIMLGLNEPKKNIWQKIKEAFTRQKKQKLLDASKEHNISDDNRRNKFVEGLKTVNSTENSIPNMDKKEARDADIER